MNGINAKARPKFLNLFRIGLPLTGVVSIFHRISGFFLILAIPFWLYLLDASLIGPNNYRFVVMWLHSTAGIAWTAYTLTALFFHFFAGLRFLAIDLGWPMDRARAKQSGSLVFAGTFLTLFIVLVRVL